MRRTECSSANIHRIAERHTSGDDRPHEPSLQIVIGGFSRHETSEKRLSGNSPGFCRGWLNQREHEPRGSASGTRFLERTERRCAVRLRSRQGDQNEIRTFERLRMSRQNSTTCIDEHQVDVLIALQSFGNVTRLDLCHLDRTARALPFHARVLISISVENNCAVASCRGCGRQIDDKAALADASLRTCNKQPKLLLAPRSLSIDAVQNRHPHASPNHFESMVALFPKTPAC